MKSYLGVCLALIGVVVLGLVLMGAAPSDRSPDSKGRLVVVPGSNEIGSTGPEVCGGPVSADGGTAHLDLPPGDCRLVSTGVGCVNLSTAAGTGMLTSCSATAPVAPAGFRIGAYAPESETVKTMTPTPDAGASDAAVYFFGSETGTMCLSCKVAQ